MESLKNQHHLKETEEFVRSYFESEGTGHDWWHIHRVRQMALKIAKTEGGDQFLIEMAALLHDLDDWKLNPENESSKTKEWLNQINLNNSDSEKILEIISQISFKGARVENLALSAEARIVQDADRLDAIGAIGVARAFSYGGSKSRLIYHPDIPPVLHDSFESYKNNTAPTINHFYEKLLLIKKRLNTQTAIDIAEKRHKFMEAFLNEFFDEWEGIK